MRMDKETLQIQMESGGATIVDLAREYTCSVEEMQKVLQELDLPLPRQNHKAFAHIEKLKAALRPLDSDAYPKLIFDDPDCKWINGLELEAVSAQIKADRVVNHFHGEPAACYFCGKTEGPIGVRCVDERGQNMLITNLQIACQECLDRRYKGMPIMFVDRIYKLSPVRKIIVDKDEELVPANVVNTEELADGSKEHTIEEPFTLQMTFGGPIDRTVGAPYDWLYVDEVIDRWIVQHFRNTAMSFLLPQGVRPTLSALAFIIWKQATHFGLLKGLVRIELEQRTGTEADSRSTAIGERVVMNASQLMQITMREIGKALEQKGGGIITPDMLPAGGIPPGMSFPGMPPGIRGPGGFPNR
jgi:hypothetical protein